MAAVVNVMLEQILQRQDFRLVVDQSQKDDAVVDPQVGEFVKLSEDCSRVIVTLDLNDDAHSRSVSLIVDIGYAFKFSALNQVGDLDDELLLADARAIQ